MIQGPKGLVGGVGGLGRLTASSLNGTLNTAAQPNITSVGTLSSLDVTGNLRADNTMTVGAAEICDLQMLENEKWRMVVSSDSTANFFQLETLVNSQWQSIVRIDK